MEDYIKKLITLLGMNLAEVRWQVINVTTANPTPANTLTEVNVQLDRDYNNIVGIGYFETDDGGLPEDYNVGARTNRKTWIDDININAWDASSGVSPILKYYPVRIPYGSGDVFYARVTTNGTISTGSLTGQMVLILSRTLVEVPK